jgi:hypothetical protein
MDNNKDISYIVFEGEMARAERHIKRLWITVLVTILLLAACNIAWLIYINQFDVESYQVSTEGGGNANYIGNDGDITNGESNSSSQDTQEQESNEETR